MAELKTKQNTGSVTKFLNAVDNETKRRDCFEILKMMQHATGLEPMMWGTSIVGFGNYHYKYESGHEGDMCLVGFSPRKQNIVLYSMAGVETSELFEKLGKYKTGKGCLYINKLSDVDTDVLKSIIKTSFENLKRKHA